MNKHKNTKVASEAKSKPKIMAKPRIASASQLKAKQTSTVAKGQGAKKPLAKQQNIKNRLVKTGEKAKSKSTENQTIKKSEKFPHFRYYLKSKHPALIVGEQPIEEYKYRKVMHGERDGDRLNEKICPNPNPKDKQPMYIGKRTRHDKKINFQPEKLPWKYPKKDKKK